MRRIRNKNKKTLILVALLLFVTIGYAYLSQLLTINGTSTIDNAQWDVHFENPTPTSSSNVVPTTAPAADPQDKVTSISYNVTFDTPGQVYEFTVNTKNGGSIDAMIKNYASTIKIGDGEEQDATDSANIPSYLVYSVTYPDDIPIEQNHLLPATGEETIKVHLEFKEDINAAELDQARNKNFTFTVSINYEQSDDNATPRQAKKYVVSNVDMVIGEDVPNGVNLRTSPTAAMEDWAAITGVQNDTKPYYLRQMVAGNKIEASYIDFVIKADVAVDGMTPGTYSIRGAGATKTGGSYNNDSIYFNDNVNTIKAAYDYAHHPGRCTDNTTEFHCYAAGIYVKADQQGNIDANDGTSYDCHVSNNGTSYCRSNS